jgi:hypothetical protein
MKGKGQGLPCGRQGKGEKQGKGQRRARAKKGKGLPYGRQGKGQRAKAKGLVADY